MVDGERLKRVFSDAIELDAAERSTFVRAACGADLELREEVVSLLEVYDRRDDRLDGHALSVSATEFAEQVLESEEATAIGRLVGAYRIENEIGRGGMGSVYLAGRADQMFTKHVAIKLLRRGTENESVVRRFEKERQVLADLEHPNIARLIDGGTTENGLPYFVMEYVAGLPVDKFCDERKLSTSERLLLFRQVCSAVEFAHERSIIHRDLKPANIHVNDKGVPKLLDFGIAKSSNGSVGTDSTATAFRLMTPEYASPEQMRGDHVGKATDIYSLGVVLYQLITGRRPYELTRKSPLEIVKAICEDPPIAPSSVPRTIEYAVPAKMAGELDKIILKALQKEPGYRYASVLEFSDDIGRLLEGLPVKARSTPIAHRMVTFYRRNRIAALSVLAASLVLSVALFSLNRWNRDKTVSPSPPAPAHGARPVRAVSVDDPTKGGTNNAEAKDLYLRAQELWQARTISALKRAFSIFQQAIDKDPNFALAYSGLSNSYFLLSVWGAIPPHRAFPHAKAASLRAIELAPSIAEGHLSLAMVYWLYEFDWPAADVEFKKAIELDPTYGRAPHWYGLYLAEMGRFDEALAAENRAVELEPESVPVKADLARVLYYARRYDEALARYRTIMRTDPGFDAFYIELAELYEATGMMEDYFALLVKLDGRRQPELVSAYRQGGIREYWQTRLRALKSPTQPASGYGAAEIYAQVGMHEWAIAALEIPIAERDHRIAQLKVNPRFDPLRSDPRFIALLKRLGLEG